MYYGRVVHAHSMHEQIRIFAYKYPFNTSNMKIIYPPIIKCSAVAAICMFSACGSSNDHHHEDGDPHNDHELSESHDHAKNDEHNEHNDNEIIIHEHDAIRLGIKSCKLEPTSFHSVIRVSGEVLPSTGSQGIVSAPTAGIVKLSEIATPGVKVNTGSTIAHISAKSMSGGDPNESARIAMLAAKRELDRATPLHEEGIVTTREYNALRANYEAALSAFSANAASGVASAPISGTVLRLLVKNGEYVASGQPIAEISQTARLTLRADIPLRLSSKITSISSANFKQSSDAPVIVLAENGGHLDASPTLLAGVSEYIPVYFTFNNNGEAVSGAYAEVYLIGSPREGCVVVPRKALIEQLGETFVYIRTGKDVYEKRKVTVGDDDGSNVELIDGVKIGDTVVTEGAMSVRLKEMSGAIPEGHSHSH